MGELVFIPIVSDPKTNSFNLTQVSQSNSKVWGLLWGSSILWKMRAQESWVLWDLIMLLPPPGLGFPFGKSVIGCLAAKNASWTTYVLSLIPETKKISDKRFLRHTCTRTGRRRGKGSNKMWRLKGGRTDSNLLDRPEKRGIGLTVKKNRPLVYLKHMQKLQDLEALAVSVAWEWS